MSYAQVITAQATASITATVSLAIQRKLMVAINLLTDVNDQREKTLCLSGITAVPVGWVTAVLLVLDSTTGVVAPTDAQIDTAVDVVWNRIKKIY